MSYTRVAPGIYRDSRTGNFYERPKIDGRPTWRKLPARTIAGAKDILAARRTDQARHVHGLAKDPYAKPPMVIGEIIKAYISSGCPSRSHIRVGKLLKQEAGRCNKIAAFFLNDFPSNIKQAHYQSYRVARKKQQKDGFDGGAMVDLELRTLRAAVAWAVKTGLISECKLASAPKFAPRKITHCRELMPKSTTELHALAAHLFDDPRSASSGWQLLLEAFTGCRTSEVLRLRTDAKPREPGFIEWQWLWLGRAKGGINPFALIHPDLRRLLDALLRWKAKHFPDNPYFIPSPRLPGRPLNNIALVKVLQRAASHLSDGPRTSHGLRAYYVTVRRSQGISDAQIAAEIGDRTGASIISRVYGEVPPNWQGMEGMTWCPKDKPAAWEVFECMPECMPDSIDSANI
jgi:integrase